MSNTDHIKTRPARFPAALSWLFDAPTGWNVAISDTANKISSLHKAYKEDLTYSLDDLTETTNDYLRQLSLDALVNTESFFCRVAQLADTMKKISYILASASLMLCLYSANILLSAYTTNQFATLFPDDILAMILGAATLTLSFIGGRISYALYRGSTNVMFHAAEMADLCAEHISQPDYYDPETRITNPVSVFDRQTATKEDETLADAKQ